MRFQGDTQFKHQQTLKLGVLLTNLGTPDEPTTAGLRRYLSEFLSDPRVVEIPRLVWWLILHGIILRLRPKRSAKNYQSIWTEQGSPLLAISESQLNAVADKVNQGREQKVEFALGMRYGNPSIESGLNQLRTAGVDKVIVLPLYPQYSSATTGSTFDAVSKVLQKWRWVPSLQFINGYTDNPDYINALADSIREFWQQHGQPQKLLFSYHGIPKQSFLKGDPYYCQCHKTTRLVVEALQLEDGQWQMCFQSRFGKAEWLQPYTDKTLMAWGEQGVESVHVVCPGFSADCLETLEEIAEENREYFIHSGGKSYDYIPALNTRVEHIDALTSLIQRHLSIWEQDQMDLKKRLQLAQEQGAIR